MTEVDEPAADLLVVFQVDDNAIDELPAVICAVREVPRLARASITLVCSARHDLTSALKADENITVVEVPSDADGGSASAICNLVLASRATFSTVAVLPSMSRLPSWSRRLLREIDRLEQVALVCDLPLLVRTDETSKQVVASYIHQLLTVLKISQGSPLADYLGRLALRAATPLLEAVDPRAGDIEILGFLAMQFMPEMAEPPWRYRLVLTGPGGDRVRSPQIALTRRVDSHGVVRWEELKTILPLVEADAGHHKISIEVDTDIDLLRTRRNLRPRRGALISARTVSMRVQGHGNLDGLTVRYLLHTTGAGSAAYLTAQVGTGRAARLRWFTTLLKKDAGFILRGTKRWKMRWLRLLLLMSKPFFANKRVWLIGERTDTAQDNGIHLFRHLRRERPEEHVYYIIDRASPQYSSIAGMGNVVGHSSWRHQLLMLHATVLANAYSIRYLIPRGWSASDYTRHLVWRVGALRVYLKHGVHMSPNSVKRGTTGYDVCLTAMPGETAALRRGSGYDRQLLEVGMPRYDALIPTPPSRNILFMPTWRKYLVTKVLDGTQDGDMAYEGSSYERFMTGFLQSKRLQEMLSRYDYSLTFLPHYNMAPKFVGAKVAGDRIDIADASSVTFQSMICNCDAFITDYSSVHFDAAYLGTPIIYARFDQDEFESLHSSPSWFDYNRDGFGPVVYTLEETLDAIDELLERECAPDPHYVAKLDQAFTYRDNQNCARVVRAVESALAGR